MSESYDMIDKFLRNNLGDEEYSLYSKALDEVFSGKGKPVGRVKTIGGYPDESEHTVEWLVKHKDIQDGDLLFSASQSAEATSIPAGWEEQFKDAVYDNLAAADNQDIPLEEYPDRILSVLEAVVGPRHPTVIKWRNDAISACILIAYKYCRDSESYGHLKQDLETLITSLPQRAETAIISCHAALTQEQGGNDGDR